MGASIEVEGERLRVDAPVGIVTEELRAAPAEHKPRLLKLLERKRRKLEETEKHGLVSSGPVSTAGSPCTTPQPASGTR